jgi:hypothetical protein
MAIELLPEDFEVKGLRVEYRVAAKYGDTLFPTIYKTNEGFIISLSINDERLRVGEQSSGMVSAIIEFVN